MFKAFAILPNQTSHSVESIEELAHLWSQDGARVWVDLERPEEEEMETLDRVFDLDEVALEDCLHGEQRPRIDDYDRYIFMVLYGLYGLKEEEELEPHKLAAFCGPRFLITVHRYPILTVRQVKARCGRHPEGMLGQGVDFVLFTIIDEMVDDYLRIVDRFDDDLDKLEDMSFEAEFDDALLSQVADVRKELLQLRRLANAQRQLLRPVAKGEFDFVSDLLSQRFDQVCGHLTDVIETVDGLRDRILGIRDNYHAALTHRTNEIVKALTLFAGILLPLSLVAGIYGMNLPVWPPAGHPLSFWGVLLAMGALGVALYFFFRRRKWL